MCTLECEDPQRSLQLAVTKNLMLRTWEGEEQEGVVFEASMNGIKVGSGDEAPEESVQHTLF